MSLNEQIHQVIGQSFSNPEHSEWLVATYAWDVDANEHAAFLNEFYRLANDPANNSDPENLLLVALRENHPFDPGFVDHGEVKYLVRALDVLSITSTSLAKVDLAFLQYKKDFEKKSAENKATS